MKRLLFSLLLVAFASAHVHTLHFKTDTKGAVTTASIGSPPQIFRFDITLDTHRTFVASSDCTECTRLAKHLYDVKKSLSADDYGTGVTEGCTYCQSYSSKYKKCQQTFKGVITVDTFHFGPIDAKGQMFSRIEDPAECPSFSKRPIDGQLGLAWNAHPNMHHLFYHLMETGMMDKNEFAVDTKLWDQGDLVIGAHDSTKYSGNLRWVENTGSNWVVNMTEVRLGKFAKAPGINMFMALNPHTLAVPKSYLTAFAQVKPLFCLSHETL
jgi:hypothetical protein